MSVAQQQLEFWTVENTGWSGGISWFKGDTRFSTFDSAMEYAKEKKRFSHENTCWRVVHHKILRDSDERVSIEKFIKVE